MPGFFKDIVDNIYAEISLAMPPSDSETYEIVKNAVRNGDGYLCQCIDDDIDSISAGIVLNELEKGTSIEDVKSKYEFKTEQFEKILSAMKILDFLRSKKYDDSTIANIGKISQSLQKNNGDITATAKECDSTIEFVSTVPKLFEEFEAEECETDEQKKMLQKICAHKDFGKRNPVDIGIDCGYSENEVLRMLRKFEGK